MVNTPFKTPSDSIPRSSTLYPKKDNINRSNTPQTTIKISMDMRDRLKGYGRMGDNYTQVLKKVLDSYDKNHAL